MNWRPVLLLPFFALLIPVAGRAQGIAFESGSWDAVVSKAKSQNRLIYLDVYASWCRPCSILEKFVFPDVRAAEKYNAAFVNYRANGEEGEGIWLKSRYYVTAYPTHLFIEPRTGAVVHRYTGGSASVITFVQQADTALAQRADTLSIAQYQRGFQQGKREPAFLLAYLKKAAQTKSDNATPLDAYVRLLQDAPVSDSLLHWIIDQIQLVNTQAVSLLLNNRGRINSWYPATEDYLGQYLRYWINSTFLRATQTRDTAYLYAAVRTLNLWDCPACTRDALHYQTLFYAKTGTSAQAWSALEKEMSFFMQQDEAWWNAQDKRAASASDSAYRRTLAAGKLPADSIEILVLRHAESKQSLLPSRVAAASLIQGALSVYELRTKADTLVNPALQWAERAEALSALLPEYKAEALSARAHLLYRKAQQREAVSVLQQAAALAQQYGFDATGYLQAIAEMKSGKIR